MNDKLSVVEYPFPVLISRVINHSDIKHMILDSIKQMGRHSVEDSFQSIWNTDYYTPREEVSPYVQHIGPAIDHHNQLVAKLFNSSDIFIENYWFQQYNTGDYHNWHVHPSCMFTNIYYVDLEQDSPKTSLRILDNHFDIPVEQGMIVTFPSFIQHCSKPNKSNYIKTAISFNSSYKHTLDAKEKPQ